MLILSKLLLADPLLTVLLAAALASLVRERPHRKVLKP